jgi:hypothetical protein
MTAAVGDSGSGHGAAGFDFQIVGAKIDRAPVRRCLLIYSLHAKQPCTSENHRSLFIADMLRECCLPRLLD